MVKKLTNLSIILTMTLGIGISASLAVAVLSGQDIVVQYLGMRLEINHSSTCKITPLDILIA